MVANIRCEEIAADQLAALLEDQAWASLKGEASAGVVADFGQRASTLLHSCLTGIASVQQLLMVRVMCHEEHWVEQTRKMFEQNLQVLWAPSHHDCLAIPGYDEEARYFEAAVRADKRQELVAKAYAAVAGVRDAQLAALKARTLQRFQADLQAAVEAGDEGFSAAATRWAPCHRHASSNAST
jgi:Root hair defective 3 GTP-binding protein (RHD3)